MFDTWGGVLTPQQYREFSLRYMQRHRRRADARARRPPRAHHPVHQGRRRMARCDGAAPAAMRSASTGRPISRTRAAPSQDRVALQGNLDPNCSVRAAGRDPRGSRARAGELRPRPRARVQSRSRHSPGVDPEHARRDDRGGARAQPGLPQAIAATVSAERDARLGCTDSDASLSCFCRSSSRSARRRILPTLVFGSSLRK